MQQYSVLLVDDEEEVIRIMMEKFDWEGMGFTVAGYAHNGVEALEAAEECQPDVVLTDIKMPYMDGLTLSRKLKERYKAIRIIIFSGFDEFEYAREAIKIEVEEYLLKPVDAKELRQVFSRVKESLDRERDERQNMDKLRAYYMDSLPVLQESFFTSLIEGRIPAEQIEKYLDNYRISMDGPYYVVTILHLGTADPGSGLDPFLLTVAVKKLAQEQVVERYRSRTLLYLREIILISQLADAGQITEYTDFLDGFCRLAKRVCHATVTAGVGGVCGELKDLEQSYLGARNAVSYRVLYGNTRAINIAEIDPQEPADRLQEEDAIRDILKKIRMGDPQSLKEAIASSMGRFAGNGASLEQYRTFVMELTAEMLRFGNSNHLEMEQVPGKNQDVYELVFQAESGEELLERLTAAALKMQELVARDRQDTTKSFVTKALEYVKDNYQEQDISVETVCKSLGVSAAYFSTVFKKITGKTFISYLTDYRMEQAAELLSATSEKTYLIAAKVGYADANYFSYVFKKRYGISPSGFRGNRKT